LSFDFGFVHSFVITSVTIVTEASTFIRRNANF